MEKQRRSGHVCLCQRRQMQSHRLEQLQAGITIGPAGRLRQLQQHPVHAPFVAELLQASEINVSNFMHRNREAYRTAAWVALAQRRAYAFAGLADLERDVSMAQLGWLRKEARLLQKTLDRRREKTKWHTRDPRYRVAILTGLHHGGMYTAERLARQDRRLRHDELQLLPPGVGRCPCGRHWDTVEHISWYCPLYATEREPAH